MVGGAVAGKAITSTALKTNIAKILNTLGKKEMGALESYIKSGGADVVGKRVLESVMEKATKATPLAPSKPLKPSTKTPLKQYSHTIDTNNQKQVNNLYNQYTQAYQQEKTLVIDSDNIKKMFADYNPKKPELVHEVSSALSDKFFEHALKTTNSPTVSLTM